MLNVYQAATISLPTASCVVRVSLTSGSNDRAAAPSATILAMLIEEEEADLQAVVDSTQPHDLHSIVDRTERQEAGMGHERMQTFVAL